MPDDIAAVRDTMRKLRDDAHEQKQPQLARMYGMRAVTLSLDRITAMFKPKDKEPPCSTS